MMTMELFDRWYNYSANITLILDKWFNDVKLRPYYTTYCSSEAQNEFIELIGTAVKEKIVQEIKKAGLLCIMADTTPNLSHKDKLSVVVCYVNEN